MPQKVWLGRGNSTADVYYSREQAIWTGTNSPSVNGYTVHTTAAGPGSRGPGLLWQIGTVYQRGIKQTGKWTAMPWIRSNAQPGFATRADAGEWLLKQTWDPTKCK